MLIFNSTRQFSVVLILLSSYYSSMAQNKMGVTFILDKSVDPTDLHIYLDDGINHHALNDSLGKSTFHLKKNNRYYRR